MRPLSQDASVLVISCDDDEAAATRLAALGFTVYASELILSSLLHQQLFADDESYASLNDQN